MGIEVSSYELKPLRYKVACFDGWRWRDGYAIRLSRYPHLRFCVTNYGGGPDWSVDYYDTGQGLPSCRSSSREQSIRLLMEKLPVWLRGGKFTKMVRLQGKWIRRCISFGEAK